MRPEDKFTLPASKINFNASLNLLEHRRWRKTHTGIRAGCFTFNFVQEFLIPVMYIVGVY